eukprot:TRINITY_DN435_c2_g2_i1.p8 TRINITY_DN435_c2_g2~~TRINITY_DN435_c2_g2_i1.p8  ORF type:complete len:591 (-),score=274.18 TRINITY_DN435_c2_g2_i1:2227-3999(-)
MTDDTKKPTRRSQAWFGRQDRDGFIYRSWVKNRGVPHDQFDGRPVIGICNTYSELTPCNSHFRALAEQVKIGVWEAGGFPLEFPVMSLGETLLRPTAMLYRNLASMDVEESIRGNPIDGVVLLTGCDKTTPALLMGAASCDVPAIVVTGGPMLNGKHQGRDIGSGTVVWQLSEQVKAGEITIHDFMAAEAGMSRSAGTCNTMGTASTMNAMAEALGMSLTGCSAIPAPYRERGQMAYETGRRIVGMAHEDLRPSAILTREAFLDAIVVNAAIGGSTNAQPHIMAMARHAGVELHSQDWMDYGYDVPLLLNMQPAGKFLGERFHRAGGVPAIMWELEQAGKLRTGRITATGRSMRENLQGRETADREVIYPFAAPLRERAGFLVLKGNLFDFAIMKTSVISEAFRQRYLSTPGQEGIFECRAVVFDGSDDYHARINDPALNVDDNTLLAIRGAGPVGWPGSAEVVNMQPPDALIKRGISTLPTLGDGRQSGTSDSPSILNASPESAVGGGLAWLRDGDRVRIDLNTGECNMLISDEELARRQSEGIPPVPASQTPWQEIYRSTVGQLESGACMELAVKYQGVAQVMPRHNH